MSRVGWEPTFDDLEDFEPLDPGRINMMDPYEVRYWCKEFHCTEAELKDAVKQVGTPASAVREQLKK